ncbi:hypothetical protein LX32DRAFT_127681 [Colletotrichum zoysiae]|uniref:Uncharacterized protein n=1 Tax=Colletotrichum zoysiae TaxID=1216348 RepID=A0AAD9H9D9_9PEZI|nr:hypothetical protein LX32DRAFT_127681 [Colletotrichum zoysiae]
MSIPVEDFQALSVSDETALPKEWMDGEEGNIDKFLAHRRKLKEFYDSIGVPSPIHVTTDAHNRPRLQPRQQVSLQAADDPGMKDDLDTEYVALTREAPAGQLENAASYKMVGDSLQGVELKIVPEAEVAAFEAQGWEV